MLDIPYGSNLGTILLKVNDEDHLSEFYQTFFFLAKLGKARVWK